MSELKMPEINSVVVAGNLTKDPVFRTTSNGTPVVNFYIAVNRRYKNKNNEWKEDVCYVGIVAWNKLAESCNLLNISLQRLELKTVQFTWDSYDFISEEEMAKHNDFIYGYYAGFSLTSIPRSQIQKYPLRTLNNGQSDACFFYDSDLMSKTHPSWKLMHLKTHIYLPYEAEQNKEQGVFFECY